VEQLERVRKSPGMAVEVDWRGDFTVPSDLEPLAQAVLAEALRNIAKHAEPSHVDVAVGRDADTFTLEVRNDGVRGGRRARRRARGDGAAPRGVRSPAVRRRGSSRTSRRGFLAGAAGRGARPGPTMTVARAHEDVPLRVLVVDDHEVVHWGFRVLLTEQPWIERCLAARTADEALALTRTFRPQVALIDLFLGNDYGVDLCRSVRELSPETRVLLISGAGRMAPAAARAAGASGVHLERRGFEGGRGGGPDRQLRADHLPHRSPTSPNRCC